MRGAIYTGLIGIALVVSGCSSSGNAGKDVKAKDVKASLQKKQRQTQKEEAALQFLCDFNE